MTSYKGDHVEADNDQKLIFSGATVEEALKNAKEKLGLDPYTDISYKVIEESQKRLFKIFGNVKKEVRIEISFHARKDEDMDDSQPESMDDVKRMVADVWNRAEPNGQRRRRPQPHRPEKPEGGRRSFESHGPSGKSSRRREAIASKPQVEAPVNLPPVPEEILNLIQSQANELFKKMGMDISIDVERSNKNPSIVRITPKGEDKPWLYSRKADHLRHVEELILKMVKVKSGEDQKFRLYFVGLMSPRRRRVGSRSDFNEPAFTETVRNSIDQVKKTGTPVTLGPFNSYERRLIHKLVSGEQGLSSTSVGEGALKQVKITRSAHDS
jgi:predicted RNA-binding protein Jag